MKLMLITADPSMAAVAQSAGVDWIFVDLEINGKEERQGHLDTVISRHTIEDVEAVRARLSTSELLVRVNPVHEQSKAEIDRVISAGADIVMLPFFTSVEEVDEFISIVAGRAQTCLLVETPGAAENLHSIVKLRGIDFIHIGLNDLHLGYNLNFMFELLADGTVDRLASIIRSAGIEFGFGGIARLGGGALPAERVLAEHWRVGSSMTILGRSFLSNAKHQDRSDRCLDLSEEVHRIRSFESFLSTQDGDFFEANRAEVRRLVAEIAGGDVVS